MSESEINTSATHSNEMVQRVARAICRQYEIDDGYSEEQASRAAASEMYRHYLLCARAAIKAMRELDVADVRACLMEPTPRDLKFWRAMIDAALIGM